MKKIWDWYYGKASIRKKINYQLSDIGYIANFSTWHVFLLSI